MTASIKNTIEILCPLRKCRKCDKIIKSIETLINEEHVEAEIKIINTLDEIMTKNTWILPTVIVNGTIVARGYMPKRNKILNML